jgi:acylpyruvate hydrolase
MKIICIGRNYAEHAKEMNAEIPSEPMFFLKPDTAILKENNFYYPNFTKDLHFECEIVVKIDKFGKNIETEFAHKYFTEFSLGIDFTARDIQAECKKKGQPWEKAKAFDNSAPLSNIWLNKNEFDLGNLKFTLEQNGEIKQNGITSDMLFNIHELIAHVSKYFTLKTGDLIFTGTPAGVGPVQIGDELLGKVEGIEMFRFNVK